VQRFSGIGSVWNTIKELNVGDIRESAEQPVTIAVIGTAAARAVAIRGLYSGPDRFNVADRRAVLEIDVPLSRERQTEVRNADLALLTVDARAEIDIDPLTIADQLAVLTIPTVILTINATSAEQPRTFFAPGSASVTASDDQPATIARVAGPAIVERLPDDLRIAAARRIPSLRDATARWLNGDVSFSNASYALTSGIPEMIPVLNLPLNAADMVVLTKNQALLVYKLALAFGAPPDFQAQMREVLPVIGGGFLWRQVARQLVGLIPGFGILPKVAVAYAGTYATGQAATLWYRSAEVLSREALGRVYKQSLELGRQRATELVQRRNARSVGASETADQPPARAAGCRPRIWPFRR
jgi:uncharacterized protein (DUF697 family)